MQQVGIYETNDQENNRHDIPFDNIAAVRELVRRNNYLTDPLAEDVIHVSTNGERLTPNLKHFRELASQLEESRMRAILAKSNEKFTLIFVTDDEEIKALKTEKFPLHQIEKDY